MTEWEQRVNRVLGMLNDAQATRRMAPDEYRARRRALLCDALLHGRGAVAPPATGFATSPAMTRCRRRAAMAGWWKLPLWGACMLLGAMAVYWSSSSL
ncbi:hypothetical protein [Xanthomonas translucens]|uniref:hypothetical protein n=2 Tax=Xanthomonas campestris pv. translucens TaxID=343 RepID=UPI0002A79BC4|nr:hypothetical protein [Xanthomonas translucens]AKK67163.1 hypothetical protein FD63_06535 [Xanthomonas translucens pv. undulosa]AVY67427.1 hypothetical protein NZ30_14215 [Xanthomonas translucens pv. undulosa]ELQ12856.1 hypothetical protein A989_06258 [Xanthomonas translucens DAR61454]KTF36732.1 hypothetical protein OZ12_16380 [Xanthomonas translucens pv. translucens]MBC3973331.1 hypothetical protein [Xanthomonas translucens pv. undulosa]